MDRFSIAGSSANGAELFCTLWLPEGELNGCVLMGHGLGVDREHATNLAGVDVLLPHGLAVLAMDAPLHGERQPRPFTPLEWINAWQEYWSERGYKELHTEWIALANYAAERFDLHLGYWGLSLATQYGVPFLAKEARVKAAVLGLHGEGRVLAHYAPQIAQPVYFIEQQDDELHPRESTQALFDHLGSETKVLDSNRGRHASVPATAMTKAAEFLAEQLRASTGGRDPRGEE
jgi:hypothetical protein